MRILHIVNTSWFSGAEKIACQLINAFKNEADVAYCGFDGSIKAVLKDQNIPFLPIKKMSVGELKKIYEKFKPDVIHAHDMRASFFASLSCGLIPVICHIHGNSLDSRKISLKSILFLFAAYKAKHIFWVHESSFDGYIFHSFFKGKSSILQNVLNAELQVKKKVEDCSNYDYDVVYLGRLTSQKNPERLLKVFHKLVAINPSVKCAIVGEGIMADIVANLIKQKSLTKNVFLLGFKNNPMKLLSDCKVMVMTSCWEGLPMCALEALALGLPVVSTPVDGLRTIVKNGINGYLSDNDDEIVNYLNKLICDKDLHDKLSRNAVALSKEYNDFDTYKQHVASVYNAVCD